MPKLPVTVTAVSLYKSGNYVVTVAFADGSTQNYIIPPTLATAEAVSISALAMAVLNDRLMHGPNWPGPSHRRYLPRTG
jgi:hypothetical protein